MEALPDSILSSWFLWLTRRIMLNRAEQVDKVNELCDIDDGENQLLEQAGYLDLDSIYELALDESGLMEAIDNGFPKRKARKLAIIAKFLVAGGELAEDTSYLDVVRVVAESNRPSNTSPQDDSLEETTYKKSGKVKPAADGGIDKYGDDPVKFEDYWTGVEHTLMQTTVGKFLSEPPDPDQAVEVEQDNALHHILAKAFLKTSGECIVKEAGSSHQNSGYRTTKKLLEYFRSDDIKSDVQNRIRNQLKALKLDGGLSTGGVSSPTTYISQFRILILKLKEAGEEWNDIQIKDHFLRNITLDPTHPLMPIKNDLLTTPEKTYEQSVTKILSMA